MTTLAWVVICSVAILLVLLLRLLWSTPKDKSFKDKPSVYHGKKVMGWDVE